MKSNKKTAVRSIWMISNFIFLFCAVAPLAATEPDIVIADFEGNDYDPGWKVEGTAFGTGPARGTLPHQMNVTGFRGKGLVNSYLGQDGAIGKLTSPEFKIERPWISFLIGGGGHEGLAVRLLVDGKVVRTATGPNTVPGGSEALDWASWDVAEFQGREAVIEIVDEAKGSWGHINVDQIVQSNKRYAVDKVEKRKDIVAEKQYFHLPVKKTDLKTWMRIEVDGVWVQEFDIHLCSEGEPDFYANLPADQWTGKKITFIAEKIVDSSQGLDMIAQSDVMSHEDTVYTEAYRPQFHFSVRTGWINDPNGLVYYDGTWHLFGQHNPFSTQWGNMTWFHATSKDLFHWTEHRVALQPDKLGSIYSGSAVVDHRNTSGFQDGAEKPIVLFFTYAGSEVRFGHPYTQGIAYSTDGGKTFEKYEKNPVVSHIIGGNRDPKVIWHEPTKQWIMALYLDHSDFALLGSKDMKSWEKLCDVKDFGTAECPDFFELPIDGDPKNTKWVFWGGDGIYRLGSFDGKTFTYETEPLKCKHGGNDYAAMTFSDVPDGRRIQMSWMAGWGSVPTFDGMPFNHQYTVPRELTLRTTPKGVRLFVNPVKELESLRGTQKELKGMEIPAGETVELPFLSELCDLQLIFDLGSAEKLSCVFVGNRIEYDVKTKTISLGGIKAPLELSDGILKLRVVLDRTAIEMFAQDGEVQIALAFKQPDDANLLTVPVTATGGKARLVDGKSWELKSVWKRQETQPVSSGQLKSR